MLLISLMLPSGNVNAGIWNEVGDAGALPEVGSAQPTAGRGPLNRITDPAAFSVELTVPDTFNFLDGVLYLFDAAGNGVVADDDAEIVLDPFAPIPAISSGSLSSAVPAGDYFLTVTGATALPDPPFGDLLQGNVAVDSNGNPLFDLATDSANMAAGAIDVAPGVRQFDRWEFFQDPLFPYLNFDDDDGGFYALAIQGATLARPGVVPEPTSLSAWGMFAAGGLVLRRKRRCNLGSPNRKNTVG